jgi:hypothetical protein
MPDKPDKLEEPAELKTPTDLGRVFIASVPRPVMAFIGTVVASMLALELVVTLGGFHSPMMRVVNAYAQRMETTALSVQNSSKVLEEQVQVLKSLTSRMEVIERSDSSQAETLREHDRRLQVLEKQSRAR